MRTSQVAMVATPVVLAIIGFWTIARSPATEASPRKRVGSRVGVSATQQMQVARGDHTPAAAIEPHVEQVDLTSASSAGVPAAVAPEATPEDQLAYATSVFEGESVDRRWAANAQREVDEGLRATVPEQVEVGPIECHSTLCRATLTVDQAGDRHEVMGALLHNRFWKGAGLVQPEGKDSVVVVLVRVGHELPAL